ncbi:uncharacterized protein LOC125570141 [Nematostella vectensis]|uniref:uncharacterized protein LOC125570141 n=1 Tax=Nematostella vectensis TaxID=45351 RepID=UPI00207736E5|nr:uncharacterized protein LOC125570141 [Nematostella vectensis]
MEKIKPPSELDIDSRNLAETWREWQESWELYKISSGLTAKEEKVQVATLYSVLGLKARRVLKTLPNVPKSLADRKVKGTLKVLKEYCMPRTNVTYESYIFQTTTKDDRPFDVFLTELRHKATLCEFGEIEDSLIRDQIVVGTNSPVLRERLLREPELTPNQMIMGRQVRTKLPGHPNALVPRVYNDIRSQLLDRQLKTKEYYDKGSKALPPLKKGDTVRFQKPGQKTYTPARITRTHDTPRSYVITDQAGREYRRNRRTLSKSNEPPLYVQDNVLEDIIDLENETTEVNPAPRRSTRIRSAPPWHNDYVMGT